MDHSKRMGQESVGKLLWKFSIPAITGMIVQALYNVVDRIYIGNGVGPMGIAGVTVAMPIMIVLLAFGMLGGIGATASISIYLGKKEKENAEAVLGHAFVLSVVGGVILSVLGLLFLDPILSIFGASEVTLPYARTYMRIIFYGVTFNSLGFVLNNCIRGEGNPMVAMVTMFLGAGLNIVLDPIFIFALDMGIAGAAWATILSQTVSAAWVLLYFVRKKSQLDFHVKNFRLTAKITKRILSLGSAPFAMQLAASLLVAIFNNQLLAYGGDIAISAYGIVNSVAMMILMPIFGLNQGSQPIIGYNYGAKQFDRVRKTTHLAILSATIIVTVGFLIVMIFPRQIIMAFSRDSQELIDLGSLALRKVLCLLPVIGFQIVASNYFQATGKPKQAMFLSLSRQVLILIPLILLMPRFLGLDGLFWANPISDALSAIITAVFFIADLRRMKRIEQETLIPSSKDD